MLFYASEKYPGEHEYTKYITEVHFVNQLRVAKIQPNSLHINSFMQVLVTIDQMIQL